MKQQINEIRRMQLLAGLINESQLNEAESFDQLDKDGGFEQWKQALYNIVMEKANLEANEIAIDDEEIKQYYQQGKTPEEVYFDIWQQDAGNFYNVPYNLDEVVDKVLAKLRGKK